jgi:hypothetical protein
VVRKLVKIVVNIVFKGLLPGGILFRRVDRRHAIVLEVPSRRCPVNNKRNLDEIVLVVRVGLGELVKRRVKEELMVGRLLQTCL